MTSASRRWVGVLVGLGCALAATPLASAQEPPAVEEPPTPPPKADPRRADPRGDEPREPVEGARADGRALGDDEKEKETGTPDWVDVGGYLDANFQVLARPQARPADELIYEFGGRAGLVVDAHPFEHWEAKLNVVFSDNVVNAVTDVELREQRFTVFRDNVPGSILQDAWIKYEPWKVFHVKAGFLRIPFSLQQQSPNATLLFPNRSQANESFVSGADIGLQVAGDFGDGVFVTSAGVFNGSSQGLLMTNAEARGVVFSYRADINPFGSFPFGEGDPVRGPFRLGLGGGVLVRPITVFDADTGQEPRNFVDTRIAASLRMAYKGIYVSAEYFRRMQSDDFSDRPEQADGAYAQTSFNFGLTESIALEPAARLGFVALDQTFDIRT
ncbi:MAG: porin, partial [Myxococcota bacterium]